MKLYSRGDVHRQSRLSSNERKTVRIGGNFAKTCFDRLPERFFTDFKKSPEPPSSII